MPVTIQTNQEGARDFLEKHPVGVLATTNPDGEPHAAAIYFIVDKDLNVSFLTKVGTKKAHNLEHKNHAVLVAFDPSSQTTVQVYGTAVALADPEQLDEVFAKVIETASQTSDNKVPPLAHLKQQGEYKAYKLTPKEVRMAVFSQSKSGGYEDIFSIITPGS